MRTPLAWVIVARRDGKVVTGSRPYLSEKLALVQVRRFGGLDHCRIVPVYEMPE